MTTEQRKAMQRDDEIDDKVMLLADAVYRLAGVVDKVSGMLPMTREEAKEITDALRIAMNYSFDISEGYMPED